MIKDLRGFVCPMNYVHTRLFLSELPAGGELEVWVDRGEPEASLPRSLERDGYEVLGVKPLKDESGVAIVVKNTKLV
jgi:TusA-related sulfurtransferase